MRIAVLADVHANHHALTAVLEAVRQARADRTLVLGDLVGYNAEPLACIQSIRQHGALVLMGNHDHDAVHGVHGSGTQSAARVAQAWTHAQLDTEHRDYLSSLPRILREPEGVVAVHGCYLSESHFSGYVTSTMLEANLRALQALGSGSLGLCGHTHIPLLGWLDAHGTHEHRLQTKAQWPKTAQAVLINPGAVGQPRDHDPRAAFALIDTCERSVELRRVGYDVRAAVRAIEQAGLPPELGYRLEEGR
jgi:diadenosine tetraphosphatase ApaH/serine/threonine PP2A family protein phosphatase